MSLKYLSRGILAVGVISLLIVGVAVAAKPKKGVRYSGAAGSDRALIVSFNVSKNGKAVTGLNVPIVQKCVGPTGGFDGINAKAPKRIKVSSKGTFKAVVKFVAITGKEKFGKETVTGKFLKGGKEKGTIKSKPHILSNCHGTTVKYTTAASKVVALKPF